MNGKDLEKKALSGRYARFLDAGLYLFGNVNNSFLFEVLDANGKETGVVCAGSANDVRHGRVALLDRTTLETFYRYDNDPSVQGNGEVFTMNSEFFCSRIADALREYGKQGGGTARL